MFHRYPFKQYKSKHFLSLFFQTKKNEKKTECVYREDEAASTEDFIKKRVVKMFKKN